MIFVLLTYGGWNEAAYIAGEGRDPQRNILRILVGGILAITAIYLLVNLGYPPSPWAGGRKAGSPPATALLPQGALSLLLVLAASFTPDGFSAMVAYTTPVF